MSSDILEFSYFHRIERYTNRFYWSAIYDLVEDNNLFNCAAIVVKPMIDLFHNTKTCDLSLGYVA